MDSYGPETFQKKTTDHFISYLVPLKWDCHHYFNPTPFPSSKAQHSGPVSCRRQSLKLLLFTGPPRETSMILDFSQPPKMNECHLKRNQFKGIFIFQSSFFRGCIMSFCLCWVIWLIHGLPPLEQQDKVVFIGFHWYFMVFPPKETNPLQTADFVIYDVPTTGQIWLIHSVILPHTGAGLWVRL